jgi:hypothetical protein
MAVTKTVGIGGDYPTWTSARDSLGATVLDDYDFVSISNINESIQVYPTYCDLNGHTVRLLSGAYHYGNPNAGHITTVGSDVRIYFNTHGNGTIIVDGLNIKRGADCTLSYKYLLQVSIRDSAVLQIRNIILNGNDKAYTSGLIAGGTFPNITVQVTNVKAYYSQFYGIQLLLQGGGAGSGIIENCSVFNSNWGIEFTDLPNVSVYNCASFGVIGGYFTIVNGRTFRSNAVNADVQFCGCSNNDLALYPNCQNGLNSADEFISTDINNNRYLFIRRNTLYNNGNAPTIEIDDIATNLYGADGNFPIGCHQYVMVADFIGIPLVIYIGGVVEFINISQGGVLFCMWDFGYTSPFGYTYAMTPGMDGVEHKFMRAGVFTITLQVLFEGWSILRETKIGYITVLPYELDFNGTPRNGRIPLRTRFTAELVE